MRLRGAARSGRRAPFSGLAVAIGGVIVITGLLMLMELALPAPNPGVLFLPLAAFVAYYWNLRYGVLTALLSLVSIYIVFIPPAFIFKPLTLTNVARLLTEAAVLVFILALARLAARRRERSEREVRRLAALTNVGMALSSELDETRLLRLIAQTACDLTGAGFAAFTLRPVDVSGQPLGPSRGDVFHLAAVVGVTPAEEEFFHRTPLGGEGLLAPIFRHAHSVRVADVSALTATYPQGGESPAQRKRALREARAAAASYTHGGISRRDLKSVGAPAGHPTVRSFLGAPLVDRMGQVRGGLLLGHREPDRFTGDDERLLVGLASQAATALENARLFNTSQTRAHELDVIFESIADGVALVGLDGAVIRENRAARDLRATLEAASRPAATSISRILARITASPSGAAAPTRFEPVLESTGAGAERREYLVSASPVRGALPDAPVDGSDATPDAALVGAVIIWRDVTETRQLVEERRARESADAQRLALQTVIDELPSAVYMAYGPDARLLLANRAAATVWGAEWQVGQPMAEFLREHGVQALRPDGFPLAPEELATVRSLRTGEAVHHYEEVIHHPDGARLPVLLNAVVVESGVFGSVMGNGARPETLDGSHTAIVVLQDVTPLKEAERLKDEFIAMAAHELKTPMAAVKGYAEMLARGPANGLGAPLEDWQREALEAIDSATARLVELTNDLLDVARLQADRLELRIEPTDLVALARRVCRRMQGATQRHHLIVSSPNDYVVADIDTSRMEQTLANLLGNAIKYSPDGGDIAVTVSVQPDGQRALLTVRDHGIGIARDQQSRLFSRFARAENARERGIPGTGLGLYLCREIVARHGGRIWLESEMGRGSVFSIELPLTSLDQPEDSGARVTPPTTTP